MSTPRRVAAVGAVVLATTALAAAAVFLASGSRYRLYMGGPASRCWQAAGALASPTSELRPERVTGPTREPDGGVRVSIDYRLDRVLGGRTLNIRCTFAAGRPTAEAITFEGRPLETEALESVNREISR